MAKMTETYQVPQYLYDALQILMPPEELTVSEWAAKYRRLDARSSASPGWWLNERVPYLVGVMDAFNAPEVERIVLCFNAQGAKTEAEFNMLGYTIQQDPAPTLMVYPTDKLAEFTSENRLVPMIRESPSLADLFDPLRSQKLELQFRGMYLALTGANSPANLASRPVKNLFLDEIDKYPGASKKEADPVSLAIDRTITFHDSKIVLASTPTYPDGRIWRELQACDAEMHYFVPCPHCREFIELKWANLTWPGEDSGLTPSERAEQAVYACQECGGIISEYQKTEMLRKGEWRPVQERNAVHRSVGFWINALYSPFVHFSKMAMDFMATKDDPELLQNFINSMLAEPWEDQTRSITTDLLKDKQSDLPEFVVPDWAQLLTGGVDVQQDTMYYTIRAWGAHATSQNIAHGQVSSWAEIEMVMDSLYERADGEQMQVSLTLIDSGYSADEVYEFCVDHPEWAAPVKGSSVRQTSPVRRSHIEMKSSRAYGMELFIVDSGEYKDAISGRLHRANDEAGAWMVYAGCDLEYMQQITAEHKIRERLANGRVRERWVLKRTHADNHYLDCEVYAFAAADLLYVRRLHLMADKDQPTPVREDRAGIEAQDAGWFGTHGSWFERGREWLGG